MSRHRPKFALDALDLALESQRLESEKHEALEAFLPLLDAVEKVCRPIARHGVGMLPEKVDALALLPEIAADAARNAGLERTGMVGQLVDPDLHEVLEVVGRDELGPGVIADVIEGGWLFDGHVLRRAKVLATAIVRA